MAKRKLPLLTERSLAQTKAASVQFANDLKLPEVSCKAGCAHCCSYPLYISILEGMILFRYLTNRGHWTPTLRKKLEQHSTQTYDLPAEIWLLTDIPCPLLDKNNKCSAYAVRPFSCRTLYAISEARLCHPHRMANAHYVSRDDATAVFREAEARILARHKLPLMGMPVSKAILLGEKIINGEGDLEHFVTLAVESLKEAQT